MGLFILRDKLQLEKFEQIRFDDEHLEKELEDLLENNLDTIDLLLPEEKFLVIGRQVLTGSNKRLDLLCIDSDGRPCIIEVKRGTVSRDVIGQVLEYAAWLNSIDETKLESIAKNYFSSKGKVIPPLRSLIADFFEKDIDEVDIVMKPRIIIVGQDFQDDVKLISEYLRRRGIDINCVEFAYYRSGGRTLLLTQLVVGMSETERRRKIVESKYFSFLSSTLRRADELLSDEFKNYKSKISKNIFQVWYENKSRHFEVWVKRRAKEIEIALHLESSPESNQKYFNHLKKYESELRSKIHEKLEFYDWPTKYNWKSIRVLIPVKGELENYIDEAAKILKKMIENIQPIINQISKQFQ